MNRRGFLAGALAAVGLSRLDTGGLGLSRPAPSGRSTPASDGPPAGTVPPGTPPPDGVRKRYYFVDGQLVRAELL